MNENEKAVKDIGSKEISGQFQEYVRSPGTEGTAHKHTRQCSLTV